MLKSLLLTSLIAVPMERINTLFKTIDQKNRKKFLGRAFRYTNCWEMAKDLLQDVYAEISQNLKREQKTEIQEEVLFRRILQYIKWRGIDLYNKKQRKPEVTVSYRNMDETNPVAHQNHRACGTRCHSGVRCSA